MQGNYQQGYGYAPQPHPPSSMPPSHLPPSSDMWGSAGVSSSMQYAPPHGHGATPGGYGYADQTGGASSYGPGAST